MPKNQNPPTPYLDSVREKYGGEELRRVFYLLHSADPVQAAQLINESSVSFATLYALLPEIAKLGLQTSLNARNAVAHALTKDLLAHNHTPAFRYKSEEYPVLGWMFHTGCKELYLGDAYDELMDLTALILTREYADTSCMQPLEELIFARHRLGRYTYDAEWAFFGCGEPQCIALAAKRLLSKNARDVQQARRLLRFIPCFEVTGESPAQEYQCVMRWLSANKAYLYYTGEGSQKSFNPCPFRVSLEHKYLQRLPDAADEAALPTLARFNALPKQQKESLSDYSHALHRQNPAQWQRWMQASLDDQVKTVMSVTGGAKWL
jgi:hypothetical protein